MENGDLEKKSEPLDTAMTSADAGLATIEPAATESTTVGLAAAEPVATEAVTTEAAVISLELATKEPLWQRLRNQPRETAAVVVLVVTAIIWLDSGDTNSNKGQKSKSLDPMEGFESYLSDFETEESSTPLRESADPVVTQSPRSFGSELMIPQTQQSEFASTVTANYGDSAFEPGNSSTNNRESATTTAQYPGEADAYSSPTYGSSSSDAASDMNNSGSQQNRRVRFAGRIKPAN